MAPSNRTASTSTLLVTLCLALAGCAADAVPPAGDGGGAGGDLGPVGDASTSDAAIPDAARPDAGPGTDAGTPDLGADMMMSRLDAGPPDLGVDAGPARDVFCGDPVPEGAERPPALPAYSGGMCPSFVAGRNTIATMGGNREFLLILPEDGVRPDESLPLVFLWHWLGGSANGFRDRAMVQDAVNRLRFIAVIPEARSVLTFKWPYLQADPGCVIDTACNCDCAYRRELAFFDDLLACVGTQFTVDRDCVSSVGVSAGALWTAQLASQRSQYLASMLVLSGGVGTGMLGLDPASTLRTWSPAAHKLPALVLWGGPSDFCFLFFESTSQRLEAALAAEGHFVEECIHNCMHSVPPFESAPDAGQFDVLWDFVRRHPYWLRDGESPYQTTGLPPFTPPWCGLGVGSATIRVGECPGTTPFLGSCA
jgi:predicted esterase